MEGAVFAFGVGHTRDEWWAMGGKLTEYAGYGKSSGPGDNEAPNATVLGCKRTEYSYDSSNIRQTLAHQHHRSAALVSGQRAVGLQPFSTDSAGRNYDIVELSTV